MVEKKKRRSVDHRHPAIAAAIHVLKDAGGGPLQAKLIFDRAFDRGLLAATAYNTLRGRLSQHQQAAQVVVLKTPEGYMLAPSGVPRNTPTPACAPSRPLPPAPLQADPLAVLPPTPSRRRKRLEEPTPSRARDIVVTAKWLYDQGASANVLKWVRLSRWRSRWRDEDDLTARDLLTGWLPPDVAAWLVTRLPLDPELRALLRAAAGQAARVRIIETAENNSRRSAPPVDTSTEEGASNEQGNGTGEKR